MNQTFREIFRSWNWPCDGSDTLSTRPTPYNISLTRNIPLSSVYRSWHLLFDNGYVRKVILLPDDSLVNRSLVIFQHTNYDDFQALAARMDELYFLELIHYGVVYYASGSMNSLRDGQGVVAAEVLSPSSRVIQKQVRLLSEFMSKGVTPILSLGDQPRRIFEKKIKEVAMLLSYDDLYELRTANIASNMNISHRTAQRLVNSVLRERLVFAYPIVNQSVIERFNTGIIFARIEKAEKGFEISKKAMDLDAIFKRHLIVRMVNGALTMLFYYDTQGELDECIYELQRTFKNFSVITRYETLFNEEVEKESAEGTKNHRKR